MMLQIVTIILLYSVINIGTTNGSDLYHPIIIVPGLAGSRLYFSSIDETKSSLVWVNPYYLARISLMIKYMKLQYNKTSHTSFNPYGFKYTWKGFGDTYMIEHLTEVPLIGSTDYHIMIKKLSKNLYYKRNITLRAAPYDFRKAPNELATFFTKLKSLVEETYSNRNGSKVVLLGHSLGCLISLSFLKKMSYEWKQSHIKAYLCVAGPLGGSVKDLVMMTSGRSVIKFDNPILFREFERTFPVGPFLLPQELYFSNKTLVQTGSKKYTAKSYEDLFNDMNMTDGYSMYQDVKDLVVGSESPTGVDEVYCIHGQGINTINSYFLKNFDDTKPLFKYGPGDGTVNLASLEICKEWKNVKYYVIEGVSHKQIVHDDYFMKILTRVLVNRKNGA